MAQLEERATKGEKSGILYGSGSSKQELSVEQLLNILNGNYDGFPSDDEEKLRNTATQWLMDSILRGVK